MLLWHCYSQQHTNEGDALPKSVGITAAKIDYEKQQQNIKEMCAKCERRNDYVHVCDVCMDIPIYFSNPFQCNRHGHSSV